MENLESEIKFWLKSVFPDENISEFTLEIEGNSEKGDGFSGEILFVNLRKPLKELHLALKCSNRNEAVRAQAPLKECYGNEIYVYTVICNAFSKFQQEKCITEVFNSMPKYYGAFIGENLEVIVFENLKKSGYELWDKKKPVTTNHMEMVLEEYGKWHALSVALRDQKPEEFKQLSGGLNNIFKLFCESANLTTMFERTVKEAFDLLRNELDEESMKEGLEFSGHISKIILDTHANPDHFSLIVHGDCWNNNFMYKIDGDANKPLKVAIIDWQVASLSSPVVDLSNFIYCCGSKDDLDNLDELLKKYYSSFSTFAKKLGTDVEKFYPFSQLLTDWKTVAKYGIIMGITVSKICLVQKEEIQDLGDVVEKGLDLSEMFLVDVKDSSGYKSRARHLIEHALKRGILKPIAVVSPEK